MNVMTTEIFEENAGQTANASVQQRDAVLARLMKAWESKNARTAKRAGGMSLIAVTLAACNGSSGGSSSDDGDGGDGGDGGTPPVVPPLVEPNFFILDFPTKTVTTTVFNVDGEPVSVEDALAAFAELADVDLSDGDTVTVENLNVVQEALGGEGEGGQNVITIGEGGDEQQLSFDEFLDLIQTQDIITVGRVILTPQENSGVVFAPGFATGDQFEEGEFGTSGNPGSGDDVIFFGRTELLHSAIIDGGGGADEVVVVAKGNYAQPQAISNIETVRILNSENTTVDVLDEVDGQNILTEEELDFLIVSTFPTFNSPTDDANSWIDLGSAFGLTSLVIGENAAVTNSNLFVVGVNNAATLTLQGGFENDVAVDYGFNFGGGTVFNLRLEDVNFNGGQLIIAQTSTHLAIESTGSDATVENYIANGNFGGNLRQLTITGDKFLYIDDNVDFNAGRPTTIDAGANTGGVELIAANNDDGQSIANNTINLTGSQGDDDFTLTADAFNITSGAGTNTFNLTGSYNGQLVEGMRLVFDGSAGEDTIILNDGNNFGTGGDGPIGNDGGFFEAMLAGSSITGVENSLVVSPNTNYSLTEATLEGITSVAVAPGSSLAVTGAQVGALGAGVFSVLDADEFVASPPDAFPTVAIVLEEGDDVTLADLIDVTALDSNVKLGFRIPDNATLTLTAEELHNFVANPGILMGNDDTNQLESVGNLVITNAGENFNPFFTGDVAEPGLGLLPGGGTVVGSTNNVEIDRSEGGFERPSQEPIDDTFLIDSSDGAVTVGPNDFGEDDEFTLPQDATKLVMEGANDITFTAPVSFGDTNNFIVNFGAVEGVVSGLEIVDFHNITTGIDPDNWGEVIGNGDARVDVQLGGNVGNANNGLISSGVATYVVVDLNDGDRQFWTSDPTEDLEVLGLQGNDGQTITFGNVRNGVNFLMEGDGFASFEDVPKALEPLDESNIGTLQALFAPGSGTVSATVEVNNQGVELGASSDNPPGALPGDPEFVPRELYVDGIDINGAQTITVNISDGDADIGGAVVGNAGVSGDVLEDLFLNSADDVTLTVDDGTSDLETLDASGVDGTMTLFVLDGDPVDLSDTTLTGIEAVVMQDGSELQLTVQQALDVGIENVSVDGADEGNEAELTLNVTEDFDLGEVDFANLPEGLSLQLSIQADANLDITGEQAVAMLEAGVTIVDGFDPDDGDAPGTVNIIDFNQTHLDDVQDDGSVDPFPYEDLFGSPAELADLAGTVTTDGSDVYVYSGATSDFFGEFDWELEGGTLGLTEQSMADELVVNNGDVQFFFIPDGSNINAADYTAIGTVFVNEFGLPDPFNVESITFLDSDTEVEIVPLVPLEFDGVDRTLIVGGVPFAINDDGTPFNPATGDAGPVTSGVNLLFNNVSGDSNRNVETVSIAFGEGGNIIGNIEIGAGELPDGNAFETLTLFSNGDEVNTVQDISATGNNLINVAITANEAFGAQTITLSSLEDDADGVVTITGSADVTLKAIDTSDADVDTLTVNTTGYTGTLDITGGSPSIIAGEELTFSGTVDSTVLLDTADLTPPDDGNLGVDGNGELTLIDASGMAGTLALGDVDNVADGFTLTGGTGVITANVLALPADNWSLDISVAGAGSAIDFVLDGDEATLTAGSVALTTDEDTGETTLTFGDDTALLIEGPLDLSLAGFDNVVFGSGVTIELGEDGLVTMDDDTFADFDAAGGTIIGETAKTFDAGVDLQDVRGLTEVNIEDEAAGTVTLSSDQVAIARIVDTDDPATDPDLPSDFGDIQALNDAIDLAIVVKEGESFAVTDNEIDGVAISGDGSVVTTIEGIAGAELTLDPASGDNNPGQSITVDYTLDGAAGSVTLNNTATNFTSPAAINAALASTLSSVDGLNAGVAGGVISVQADDAGVEFAVTNVDTSDTNGAGISFASNVESTADMSGNTVADTTHVFEALATGGYQVTGTLGGDSALEIEGENFIDLTGATVPAGPLSINITGDAELKVNEGDLGGLIVTGDGSVQADVAGPVSGVDLSGIDVPLQFNVTANPVTVDGATEFNSGQPLTLVGPEGFPAPGPVFDITGLDTAGDVPNLNRPSSVELDNVDFTLTAAQADGLVVTGASEVTVDMDSLGSDNSDLSGIDVDLEITSDDDLDFGGNLPSGQPIKFSSSSDIISLNGTTIPAGAVVSIAANTTLDVTGGTLGAGVSFVMETGSVLDITGAQADGKTIEGAPDPITGDPQTLGTVNITGLDGTQDLSGIDGPALALTFADDAVEGSVAASAIDGQAISIVGGDPAEDFTLTITGLEDAPEADLTGLTLGLATATDKNVSVEVDSTGDVTIGENADLTIGGVVTSVTLDVTGTGAVDVEDGADLSGIGAFTVAQGSTLVTDATLADANSIIEPADVTGSGKLQYVELDTGTFAANGDVRTNEFVFDSSDTTVTINDFEAEVGNGFFVFDDTDPLNPILGTMSLNLSDFDTTGTGFETIATGATQTDVDGIGVIVVEDGSDPTGLDLSGANNGEDAQLFFAFENGADTEVQYWSDDGAGGGTASDGTVDAGELTLVATLTSTDTEDLGSANFTT